MTTDDGNTRLCQWLPDHFSRRRSSTSGSPSSLSALEFTRQQAIERTAQYPHGILDLLFDQKSSSSNSSVWARSATISFTVAPRNIHVGNYSSFKLSKLHVGGVSSPQGDRESTMEPSTPNREEEVPSIFRRSGMDGSPPGVFVVIGKRLKRRPVDPTRAEEPTIAESPTADDKDGAELVDLSLTPCLPNAVQQSIECTTHASHRRFMLRLHRCHK